VCGLHNTIDEARCGSLRAIATYDYDSESDRMVEYFTVEGFEPPHKRIWQPLSQLHDTINILRDLEARVIGRSETYPMTERLRTPQPVHPSPTPLVDPGIDSPLHSRQLLVQPSTPVIISPESDRGFTA